MRSKWQNRKCDRSLKTFRWNLCNMILCYNLIFCRNVNYANRGTNYLFFDRSNYDVRYECIIYQVFLFFD